MASSSSSSAFCSPIPINGPFPPNVIRESLCNLSFVNAIKEQHSLCLRPKYRNLLCKHPLRFSVRSCSASPFKLPTTAANGSLGLPDTSALSDQDYGRIRAAKKGNPPIMPAIMTPGGSLDLTSILLRSRIIFIGQAVNSQVAQRVISQLMTLAAIDEDADILIYINCPGGSTYSVLAIYDCMSWIKPKVGTVCFGVAASQGALLLAGGEKGMRYAMPNSRIMIHQPQGGCGGTVEDVRRQVNEVVASRDKIDKMYASFTGQPLEKVQTYTDRDRFFSAAEENAYNVGQYQTLLCMKGIDRTSLGDHLKCMLSESTYDDVSLMSCRLPRRFLLELSRALICTSLVIVRFAKQTSDAWRDKALSQDVCLVLYMYSTQFQKSPS